MKKIVSFILILIFCASLSHGGKSTDGLLDGIEKANAEINDMQADFSQEIKYKSTGELQTASGIIKYKKQNYIYMYQKKPQEQHTYVDGKKITVYVPANNQAVVEKWKDALKSDAILAVVIDFIKDSKKFIKEHDIDLTSQTDKEYVLCVKSVGAANTPDMTINIDKQTLLLNRAEFGNDNFTVNVKLKNYKLNAGLQNGIFKFKPAKNVDVIEL